jgi:hypothetical protein
MKLASSRTFAWYLESLTISTGSMIAASVAQKAEFDARAGLAGIPTSNIASLHPHYVRIDGHWNTRKHDGPTPGKRR